MFSMYCPLLLASSLNNIVSDGAMHTPFSRSHSTKFSSSLYNCMQKADDVLFPNNIGLHESKERVPNINHGVQILDEMSPRTLVVP